MGRMEFKKHLTVLKSSYNMIFLHSPPLPHSGPIWIFTRLNIDICYIFILILMLETLEFELEISKDPSRSGLCLGSIWSRFMAYGSDGDGD